MSNWLPMETLIPISFRITLRRPGSRLDGILNSLPRRPTEFLPQFKWLKNFLKQAAQRRYLFSKWICFRAGVETGGSRGRKPSRKINFLLKRSFYYSRSLLIIRVGEPSNGERWRFRGLMNNLFIALCILFLTLCTRHDFFGLPSPRHLPSPHTNIHTQVFAFSSGLNFGITNKLFQLTMQKFSAFESE